MARKRSIDPHIWEDPGFNSLEIPARLIFIGMISNADDEGYIRADAGSIKRLIFGFDNISKEEVQKYLDQIKKLKTVHFYEIDGEEYAHFVKWRKYQKQREDRIQPTTYPKCNICQTSDRQVSDNGEQVTAEEKRSKEKLNIGGRSHLPQKSPSSLASPEIKKSENLDLADGKGNTQSVGSILEEKLNSLEKPVKKKNGISTAWQDKAFRYAQALKIDLKDDDIKSRWLKVFKQAYEGRNAKNLELAYSYLSDYPRQLSNEAKIKFFFWIYERGLPKAKYGFIASSLLVASFLGIIFATLVFSIFAGRTKGLVSGSGVSDKKPITSFQIRPSDSMPSPTPTKTIEQKICEKFKEDCQVAVAVAKAESGLRCDAISPTNDHGVFQINAVHFPKFKGKDPYDCDANIEVAYEIYKRQGFYSWTVYRTGSYKRFLKP